MKKGFFRIGRLDSSTPKPQMLILVPKELEAQISDICENASIAKLRGITNLLQAYADSRHIVVAPPAICRIFEECPRLSEEHRGVAKKMRQRYPELAQLKNVLPMYAEVALVTAPPTRVAKVWTLPLDWIATHGLSEAHLICEDLYDCEISYEAARDFLDLSNLSRINLTLDHTPGGGGNTHRVFKVKAIDSQRVSVCVVDSDRGDPSPNAPLGNTANLCLQVTGTGIYELQISEGRELENHIPIRLIDKVRPLWNGTIPSASYVNYCQNCPAIMLFADLKSGIKRRDIDHMTGTEQIYWDAKASNLPNCAVRCCPSPCPAANPGDCKQVIIPPLGRTLLKDVGEHLKSEVARYLPNRHRSYLPSPNDAFWTSLGGLVAAYGASVKVASTI
jgi:hypothetical protein